MSFVQIRELSFHYPDQPPLFEGLTVTVDRGECVGIRGRSGSGKSTLAQVVAGHLPPTRGEIIIDGRVTTGRPQRDVFLVHQDYDLFPWLRVREQIAFANQDLTDEATTQLMRLTRLEDFAAYYPRQLSGGMKKRLAIARALAVQPKLILFDESFSSLDYELRSEIFTDLRKIWEATGTTIILISHDPRDFEQMTQRQIRI